MSCFIKLEFIGIELHCTHGELHFCDSCIRWLALTSYRYSELQVVNAIQKLSCKTNCRTPFFFIMNVVVKIYGVTTYVNPH
jgi:hypothetical protein